MFGGVESIRASYRPKRITTLFVGESAPHNGTFFYLGNTMLLRQMKRAVELALGETSNFLESFKAYGWYVDDLVLTPVNHLSKSERIARCFDARKSLADRIAEYKPEAIVSLLHVVEPFVDDAAKEAGSNVPRHVVPFPRFPKRFRAAMAILIPKLPRL
jgi:hypothetical protein